MTARALRPTRSRRRAPAAAGRWPRAARILAVVALAALCVRTFVVMPRTIPSESMMPALLPGDYVAVDKRPYGWSRYSLPLAPPWPHGRLAGAMPARGDVVVFRAPGGRFDYVKRVIGLPGDRVAMAAGRVVLNGRPLPLSRIADYDGPARGDGCKSIMAPPYGRTGGRTGARCRLPTWRETLPGGRAYAVIDQGRTMQDDMPTMTVPAGRLFMLGDNRDLSEDSRFPVESGGIGMVPAENLEGRAGAIVASTGRGWRPFPMAAVR
jgi:signal peptidase I